MKAYKGFDKNMKCRDFQYEEGKEYSLPDGEKVELCERGFHSCENPIDIFNYYNPAESVFREVEVDGDIQKNDKEDSKIASSKIKIGATISFKTIVEASIKFIFEKCNWTKENKTGYRGAASQTGDQGAASQTGNYGAALTTGIESKAEINKPEKDDFVSGTAISLGINGKAKGPTGAWLVIAEWIKKDKWILKSVKTVKVDGVKIKADTWYNVKNGKFVKSK